jgi:hypothetical protein
LELPTLGIVKLLDRLSHQTVTEGRPMDRDELAVTALLEIDRRHAEALAGPRPPVRRKWAVVADHGNREFGPLYSPQWFGDLTATEAGRQQVLWTLRRLAEAGLVEVFPQLWRTTGESASNRGRTSYALRIASDCGFCRECPRFIVELGR